MKQKKIKFIELETIYVPDNWLQIKYTSLSKFLEHFKLDKEHKEYFKHEKTIFAFNYSDHVVYFADLEDVT